MGEGEAMHEKLLEIQDLMGKLAVETNVPKAQALAKTVLKTAIEEDYLDGLSLVSREDSLIVFETGKGGKIGFGGIGNGKGEMFMVGGDGPLTFILAMIWTMGKMEAPIDEILKMLVTYSRELAETKGEPK